MREGLEELVQNYCDGGQHPAYQNFIRAKAILQYNISADIFETKCANYLHGKPKHTPIYYNENGNSNK